MWRKLSQEEEWTVYWKQRIIYIFEFKLDGTAAEALQQIEDKGYATPYQTDTRKVTAIGAGFSSETMTVEEWEENVVAQLRLNNSAKSNACRNRHDPS